MKILEWIGIVIGSLLIGYLVYFGAEMWQFMWEVIDFFVGEGK